MTVQLRIGATLVALVLLPVAAGAQEIEAGLLAEYQGIGYFSSPGVLDPVGRNQLLLRPELEGDIPLGVARVQLELRADEARSDRTRAYVREAWAELRLGAVDVRVGRTLRRWARADAVNPVDAYGRWDYTDLLDAPEEPLPRDGAWVTWYAPGFSVEAVVLPRMGVSRLPTVDSRWWPDLPDSVQVQDVLVPVRYGYAPPSWPEGGGRTGLGLRVAGSWAGWDVAGSVFDGLSDLPAWELDEALLSDGTGVRAHLGRDYYRFRSVGADFATVVAGSGVHGEVAWIDPRNDSRLPERARRSWFHWVVGIDRRAVDAVLARDLFVVLEWSREAWPTAGALPEPLDLTHGFRDALLGRAELSTFGGDATNVEVAWSFADRGWFLRLGHSHPAGGRLRIDTLLDIPGGASTSLFGTFRTNRRLHLRVRYDF